MTLLTPPPKVTIINMFARPYDNAVATARTCYSSQGIILPEQVAERPQFRDRIAQSIYKAGHHTTFQHAHIQFAIENVSRHFVWTFLHSHPFYNSEQVSQRYVRVHPDQIVIPPIKGTALEIYRSTVDTQVEAYRRLQELLEPIVERLYYARFPARRSRDAQPSPHARRWIPRKAQEVARYVLPVATTTYLYHTISLLTLLRYHRLSRQYDLPTETRCVVQRMVDAVLAYDPEIERILEDPIPLEETLEYRYWNAFHDHPRMGAEFRREFDEALGEYTSLLVSYKPDNEALVAQAVRDVLGLPKNRLSDEDAISLVLDPTQNPYLGEALNLTTVAKLTRALHHASYTFRKKLSHSADSQDQRHRMTPGSRPMLAAYLSEEPDYITPALISVDKAARRYYDGIMERTWEGINRLRALGVPDEYVSYLLPNAVAIRFMESADLLALHHKLRMRLCYNAQEEIWKASRDEALQIARVNPVIGRYLGPPCKHRYAAGVRPICPEGDRYCGVRVWRLRIEEYHRII